MGRALVMMMAAVMLIANTCSSIQKKREVEQKECQDSIQVETPKKNTEFWDDEVVSSVAAANAAVL